MSRTRPCILVVDSERDSAGSLVAMLKREYDTLVAHSGEAALRLVAQDPMPDLVLLDTVMPGLDGYEVCRRIKADAATTGIPVILVTASEDTGDETSGFAAGAADYVGKRLSPPILKARIKTHLENKLAREYLGQALGTLLDSERQRQAELRKLSEAINQSPVAITIADPHGTIEYANGSSLALHWRNKNPMGREMDLFGAVSEQEIKSILDNLTRNGGEWSRVLRYETVDGEALITRAKIFPIRSDTGEVTNFILQEEDITEAKMAHEREEALGRQLRHSQRMETVGRLAAGIAHDFNNVLTPITGYARLLRDNQADDSKEAIRTERILTAVKRAQSLVSKLLVVSRKDEVEPHPVNLAEPVEEVFHLLQASTSSRLFVHFTSEPSLWPVMADPTRIHQVVMNLCTNASQAIGEAGGNIWMRLANVLTQDDPPPRGDSATPSRWVKLTVEDDGPGMTKQTLEHIFEPFFTTKKERGGSGLGLAVVDGIVAQAGGRLTVYSEPGHGTTFHVWFPVCEEAEEITPAERRRTDIAVTAGHGETILVVDDEQVNLDTIVDYLETAGYRVVPTTSALAALDMLKASSASPRFPSVDLLLTDFAMPGMDGAALAREVRTGWPSLPILMMSGFSSRVTRRNRKVLGIDRYIAKPLDFPALASILRELLDSRATRPAASSALREEGPT
ncbi:MAG: response regulator [Alphaproteobacteria bacterium]